MADSTLSAEEIVFELTPQALEAVRELGQQSFPSARIAQFKAAFVEAERRGYEQAITHLRDTERYNAWCGDDVLRSLYRPRNAESFRDHFADYLTARLTEETTDG